MRGIGVCQQMQEPKRRGLSRNAVVARTGACWRTVDKCWGMSLGKHETARLSGRPAGSALAERDKTVLQWLREYPDIAAAQVEDWLLGRYESVGATGTWDSTSAVCEAVCGSACYTHVEARYQ